MFNGLLREIAAVHPSDPAPPLPMEVGSTIGAFELLEVIGRGGSGVVYRAHDARLDREVAIKLLWKDTARPDALLLEARKAASVSDPHVASIYEVGESDTRRFIAMELIRGASLRTHLQSRTPSKTQRLAWALQLARALRSIHDRGWIHQDVKAENIAVGEDGRIKLLDFGIARSSRTHGDNQDGELTAAGTPAYMAPEQRMTGAIDARVDVFAFGVLLQELLIGRIARTAQHQELKRHRALARLISDCLAQDPQLRPESGAALVARLESIGRAPNLRVPLALALGGAIAIALWSLRAQPERPKLQYAGRSKRLTGFELSRPLSAAALSWSGKSYAYVDDDGLWIAPTTAPEKTRRVPFTPQAVYVSTIPHSRDWLVLTSTAPNMREAWRLDEDGRERTKVWSGSFNIASLSPREPQMVLVRRDALGLLTVQGDEIWTVNAPKDQVFTNAIWSPDGAKLAVAYARLRDSGVDPCLEVWRMQDREVLFRYCSRRLIQAYVPVVHSWSPKGQLLYGLSDIPGQGQGAAVRMQEFPESARTLPPPERLVYLERQSLSSISMATDHRLLTLRQDIRLRSKLATLGPDGSVTQIRQLDQSEFDSRLSSWSGNKSLWGMSYREWVPKASRLHLDEDAPPPQLPGWAQTWVTPIGADLGALFWYAEPPSSEQVPLWRLARWSDEKAWPVQSPVQPREHLGASGTPPYTTQVRCASRIALCVLGARESDGYRFYKLSLPSGPPERLFALSDFHPVMGAWQLLHDGSGILIGLEGQLTRYSLEGEVIERQDLLALDRIRSLGISPTDGAIYASGTGTLPDNFRLVRLYQGRTQGILSHPAIAYLDVHPSPDGRRLAFVEKLIDTDLWLNFSQ